MRRERRNGDAERVVRAGSQRARAEVGLRVTQLSLSQLSSALETAAMTVTVPAFPPLLGYVPREYLAQGGQSIVYRALNHATNHLAALKVVPLDPAAASRPGGQAESAELSPAMQQKAKQLVREMRIHETLDHKNILRLFGGETRQACVVETEKGTTTAWPTGLYMVLDLGQSLAHFPPHAHTHATDAHVALSFFQTLFRTSLWTRHSVWCLQPTVETSLTRSVSPIFTLPLSPRSPGVVSDN